MIRLASEHRHSIAECDERPNKRFDTDPQQQRFAPLFRAGQSRRWASMTVRGCGRGGGRMFPPLNTRWEDRHEDQRRATG
jgi:hypothetical protein